MTRSHLALIAYCIGAITAPTFAHAAATSEKQNTLHYPADVTRTEAPGYNVVQKMPRATYSTQVNAVRVSNTLIELPCILTTGDTAQTIVLWDFYFAPPPSLKRRHTSGPAMPPPAPPPARMFTVPANTTIEFVARLSLSDYEWKGSPVIDLPWTFDSWNGPNPKGVVQVKLPPLFHVNHNSMKKP